MQRYLKLAASGAAFSVLFLVVMFLLPSVGWTVLAAVALGAAGALGTYGFMYGREMNLAQKAGETSRIQAELGQQLEEIDQTVRGKAHQLPPSTQGQLRMMVVGLQEIVERWDSLSRAPEQQEAVRRTIEHQLPRTVVLFLQLPDSAKPQHAEEFKKQVSLLAEAVAKTRDRVVRRDLQALRANGWLLEESLSDPDEKLFREHGL